MNLLAALALVAAQDPSAAEPDPDQLLASMTLEEKVGQLFVVEGNGNFLNDRAPALKRLERFVEERHVGGVIWYRSKVYETAILAAKLRDLAKVPLLFSCDLEAGMGMRFDDLPWAPFAMALAATGDAGLADRLGSITARESRALGIAQIYAPVADVNVNPDNPVINVRSFGEDAKEVARFVTAFCGGCSDGGALATVKHFPGHGDTSVDSHRSLPVLRVARERLDKIELVPFRDAFAAGCRAVMVAHLAVPALDPEPAPLRADGGRGVYADDAAAREASGTMPATLSKKITTDLLRGELKFTGLVVTDAMDMGGVADHFPPGEAAVLAILAGCDQVLKSSDPDAALDAVVAAAKSGRISPARLDESVTRILREKLRLGLFDPERGAPSLFDVSRVVGSPEHEAAFEEMARRSLTLLREETGVLPLAPAAKLAHVVVSDEAGGMLAGAPASGWASVLGSGLARRAKGGVKTYRIDPRTPPDEIAKTVDAARVADAIVVSLLVRARSSAAPVVEALLACGKPVVAVSLGSPYVLAEFPKLKTALAAYGAAEVSQRAAAAALFGEAAIGGKIPVTIPGFATRGAGIRKEPRR